MHFGRRGYNEQYNQKFGFPSGSQNLSSSDDQRITEDAFSYKMLNRILHHIHLPPIPSETHLAKAYYSWSTVYKCMINMQSDKYMSDGLFID